MILLLRKMSFGLLILLIAFGCATNKAIVIKEQVPVVTDTDQKNKVTPEELLADINKEFMELIAEAKKKGDEAINYLATDFFIKASDASMRGDAHTAAFLYKYLVALDESNDFLKKKYAIELVRINELVKAEEILSPMYYGSKIKDRDIDVGLMLGGIQITLNKMDDARRAYKDILSIDKKHTEACVFLAKTYVADKNYTEATKVIEGCEKNNKTDPVYRLFLGSIAAENDKIDLARTHFKEALKIKPDYDKAVLAIGATYEQKEQYDKATAEYQKFLKKYPDNIEVLSQIVQTMFASGSLDGIVPYLENLVEQDGTDLNSKVKLGVIYTEKKEYDKAKKIFSEILVSVPESDKILYSLGSIYQITGEADSAITYFSKIGTDSDLYHDSAVQVGKMLQVRALQEREKGDKSFEEKFVKYVDEKLSQPGPYKIELSIIKASFYDEIGKNEKALEIVASIKDLQDFNDANAYYLASLYDKVGRKEESRVVIKKIIEHDPKNAHAFNFLGYSLLETGDKKEWPEAYAYISKAVELSPNDGYIRDSLGWYYYRLGDYEKAKDELHRAWTMEKKDPIIGKHLSLVYQKLNKFDKAKEYLVEALNNCAGQEQKDDISKALQELDSSIRVPASN